MILLGTAVIIMLLYDLSIDLKLSDCRLRHSYTTFDTLIDLAVRSD